ncbi:hypothetical protein chiPu_0031400, partial [Chiloscyllium punctatum]|nr:hypothetical protein [Chiloscyllium punctatum]
SARASLRHNQTLTPSQSTPRLTSQRDPAGPTDRTHHTHRGGNVTITSVTDRPRGFRATPTRPWAQRHNQHPSSHHHRATSQRDPAGPSDRTSHTTPAGENVTITPDNVTEGPRGS